MKLFINSKAPGFMKHLMPKGSFEFHEESWNAYPYSKTVISVGDVFLPLCVYFVPQTFLTCFYDNQNPKFMKENFQLVIESIHHAGGPDVDNVCKALTNFLSYLN